MSPRPIELPRSEFESALSLAREGKCAEALASIIEVLARSEPSRPLAGAAASALAEVARLAEVGRDLETADHALSKAVELKPAYADVHHQHACVLLARGRPAEARKALDVALRLNPRYKAARLERALLDAREGLIGDSLEALKVMSREFPPEDPRAFQQGIESLEQADWDEADSLLRRAMDLSDPELQERLQRFRSLIEQGEAGRAAQLLQDLLPGRESYPDLHHLLGLAELKLGNFDDALDSFARALELNPDFHEARIQFAHALECLGQTSQAMSQLSLVLRHDPSNRRALELQKNWTERAPRTAAGSPAASTRSGGSRGRDRTGEIPS